MTKSKGTLGCLMNKFPGVMLSKEYKTWDDEAQYTIEPKIDGYRLAAVVVGGEVTFYTRTGKSEPYTTNLKHISKQILEAGFDNCMIDGEILNNNWNDTSIVRKKKLSPVDHRKLEKTNFYCFDYIDRDAISRKLPQRHRYRALQHILELYASKEPSNLLLVPSIYVYAEDEVQECYQEFIEEGWEGAMLKDIDAEYSPGKRSKAWLKLKPTKTYDCRITGFVEGLGKHEGRLGALRVTLPDGTEVSVGTGFTDSEREAFWSRQHELFGSLVEVKSQDDEVATVRHPVFVRLREDRE